MRTSIPLYYILYIDSSIDKLSKYWFEIVLILLQELKVLWKVVEPHTHQALKTILIGLIVVLCIQLSEVCQLPEVD